MPNTNPQYERAGVWLWRSDLALLRALYRRTDEGYSHHIRTAVRVMCSSLRERLRASPEGQALLHKLGQENLQ